MSEPWAPMMSADRMPDRSIQQSMTPRTGQVHVHDSTAELRYMVLPQRPTGTGDWSEDKLATHVTRDSLIGTQRVLTPG